MARKKSSRTQPNPDQFDLFAQGAGVELMDIPQQPSTEDGAMDCKQATRKWLTAAIKQSGKSREEVAETLTAWTGVDVSKDSIDMWTKPSHPSELPAHFVAPLTVILGANFLDWFAQQAGSVLPEQSSFIWLRSGRWLLSSNTPISKSKRLSTPCLL